MPANFSMAPRDPLAILHRVAFSISAITAATGNCRVEGKPIDPGENQAAQFAGVKLLLSSVSIKKSRAVR
jgi:hypothetical protein